MNKVARLIYSEIAVFLQVSPVSRTKGHCPGILQIFFLKPPPDGAWSHMKKPVSWSHCFPSFLTRALGLLLFTLLISNLLGEIWKTNITVTTTTNLRQGHCETKDLYHERYLSNYAINCKANPWSIPHVLWALRLELMSGFQAINLKKNYTSLDGSALKGLGKVGVQTDTPCSWQYHLFYTESAEQVPAESSGSG